MPKWSTGKVAVVAFCCYFFLFAAYFITRIHFTYYVDQQPIFLPTPRFPFDYKPNESDLDKYQKQIQLRVSKLKYMIDNLELNRNEHVFSHCDELTQHEQVKFKNKTKI